MTPTLSLKILFSKEISPASYDALLTPFHSDLGLLTKIYQISLKKKDYALALYLLKKTDLSQEFLFLGETLEDFINSHAFNKIPLPHFKSYGLEYELILSILFKTSDITPFKKRIGLSLKTHGIPLINNLFALRSFTDIHKDLDKVLALDHSKALSYDVYDLFKDHGGLLHSLTMGMPLTRLFKILLNFDLSLYSDIETMIDRIKSSEHLEDFKTQVLPTLPRKRTLHEIHDTILNFTFTHDIPPLLERSPSFTPKVNIELNQEINFLDKKQVDDFTISIPKTSKELELIGRLMHHCVGFYSERVLKKECFILNLKKENLLLYTLELKKSQGIYTITQFKGKHNSSLLEGPKGQHLREAILKLANAPKLYLINPSLPLK